MVKSMYPGNYWSVRVAVEKRQERKEARLHTLEEAGWVAFLALYVVVAAVIFGFKELPHGVQAIPVWIGEVVYFTAIAFAAWRYDRMSARK